MIKHAVVVDDDVNIHNDNDVLWAISTRCRLIRICSLSGEQGSVVLDPSSYGLASLFSGEGMVTKMGIDATKPLGVLFPKKVSVPDDVWERMDICQLP